MPGIHLSADDAEPRVTGELHRVHGSEGPAALHRLEAVGSVLNRKPKLFTFRKAVKNSTVEGRSEGNADESVAAEIAPVVVFIIEVVVFIIEQGRHVSPDDVDRRALQGASRIRRAGDLESSSKYFGRHLGGQRPQAARIFAYFSQGFCGFLQTAACLDALEYPRALGQDRRAAEHQGKVSSGLKALGPRCERPAPGRVTAGLVRVHTGLKRTQERALVNHGIAEPHKFCCGRHGPRGLIHGQGRIAFDGKTGPLGRLLDPGHGQHDIFPAPRRVEERKGLHSPSNVFSCFPGLHNSGHPRNIFRCFIGSDHPRCLTGFGCDTHHHQRGGQDRQGGRVGKIQGRRRMVTHAGVHQLPLHPGHLSGTVEGAVIHVLQESRVLTQPAVLFLVAVEETVLRGADNLAAGLYAHPACHPVAGVHVEDLGIFLYPFNIAGVYKDKLPVGARGKIAALNLRTDDQLGGHLFLQPRVIIPDILLLLDLPLVLGQFRDMVVAQILVDKGQGLAAFRAFPELAEGVFTAEQGLGDEVDDVIFRFNRFPFESEIRIVTHLNLVFKPYGYQ